MTKKIRVLYCIDSLKMGGAERITVGLMPFLAATEVIEPHIAILYKHDSPLMQQTDAVPVHSLGASRLADLPAFLRLVQLIRRYNFDLIHAQLIHATVMSSAASLLTGVPFVTTRHVVSDDLTTRKKQRMVWAERLALRHTSKLIYVSDQQRQQHDYDIDRARQLVLYNGIDLSHFETDLDTAALRAELGIRDDKPVVLMVGVVRPGKGHTVAIKAARQQPAMHWLLVGDGDPDLMARLRQQADGLEHVHFMGNRKDVPDLMRMSDLVILPSDLEALPTVLIEAGAAGKPAVATDVGGIPEIVIDNSTGILIPPQDPQALEAAVADLLDNPQRAAQMGQAARERIYSTFSIQSQVDNLYTLYRDVIDNA